MKINPPKHLRDIAYESVQMMTNIGGGARIYESIGTRRRSEQLIDDVASRGRLSLVIHGVRIWIYSKITGTQFYYFSF
jgi:hypothetical protein